MSTLNKYYFQGTRFVPGYNDFDFDDFEVEAKDEKEAWELLGKYTNMRSWTRVGIVEINGKKVAK